MKSVNEILKCGQLNESYCALLSCGTVYYAVQGGSSFLSLWMKFLSVSIHMKATKQYFSCGTVYYIERRGSNF